MRTILRLPILLAAICVAFATSASAQLVTVSTLPTWTGSTTTLDAGQVYGETFDNLLAVKTVTYRFVTSSTTPISPTTIGASFVEWNNAGAATSTLINFGSIVIPSSSDASWGTTTVGSTIFKTYDYSFSVDLNTLDASTTYALLFTPTSSTGLAFGLNNFGAASNFADGHAIISGFDQTPQDWAFQNVIYVPDGNFVPVPETSTVAVIFSAVLVAGLAAFRVRQRRQMALSATVAA